MELYTVWIGGVYSLSEFVKLLRKPMCLSFVDSYTAEDQIVFVCISRRTGVIQVQ